MRYFHSSIVPLLYFWSSASKWPPSILMQSSALGRTSLTALLTSSSSREVTKSLTTSLSSSRVLGLTLRTSTFPSRSESVVRGDLVRAAGRPGDRRVTRDDAVVELLLQIPLLWTWIEEASEMTFKHNQWQNMSCARSVQATSNQN